MADTDVDQARMIAGELLALVEAFRFYWEDQVFSIGVSIGLTEIGRNCVSATEVLKEADSACYAAKDAGRNRLHVYQAHDALMMQRRGDTHWAGEVTNALEQDAFVLYAQRMASLKEGGRPAYEILLRMRRPDGELVAPGAFLPAAERYNQATRIDQWVIQHSFDWLARHRGRLDTLGHLSINLSGQSLGHKGLLAQIIAQFESGRVTPGQVQFEITETAAIANLSSAKGFIRALRAYGCQFALDDFGSGLSSFGYLKNLDVDVLKIDGMFVRDMLNSPIDEAMVRSINDIGHVIGMATVAEFVENEQITQRLKELGVDYAQGYAFARPQPIDTILDELA